MIRKFNIDGCRRRRGDPGRGRPRFHCDGDVGPPCIVKRGDMVYLDVDFGSGTIFATYKSEWDFEVSSREYLVSIPAHDSAKNTSQYSSFNHSSACTVEFLTGGVELLWGNCTVFPVPVQGILTGGT